VNGGCHSTATISTHLPQADHPPAPAGSSSWGPPFVDGTHRNQYSWDEGCDGAHGSLSWDDDQWRLLQSSDWSILTPFLDAGVDMLQPDWMGENA
jgi:hypothetical protein